jgi:hypothetical protein
MEKLTTWTLARLQRRRRAFVECDAGMRRAQQRGQRALALLDRPPAQVLAVEFKQVEGAEHGNGVVTKGPG